MVHHSSALYIKLKGSPCLTHVGTEGVTANGRQRTSTKASLRGAPTGLCPGKAIHW